MLLSILKTKGRVFIFASIGDFKVKYKYFVKETVMSVSGNVHYACI